MNKDKFRRLRHIILENSFLLQIILKLPPFGQWVFDKYLKFVIEKLEKETPIPFKMTGFYMNSVLNSPIFQLSIIICDTTSKDRETSIK